MDNSAMFRAFRMLRKKPILLLLLLPVNLISILSIVFMPDISSYLDFNALMNNPNAMLTTMQVTNMVSTLVSSVVSLVSLACIFLLLPPAMELMRDGAEGRETQAGWYSRGLRSHWWKPVVNGLVAQGIVGALAVGVSVVLAIVMMVVMMPLMSANMGTIDPSMPPDNIVNGMMGNILPVSIAIGIVTALVLGALEIIIRSFLGLLLPALVDRPFGQAFKLMFSRRGLRKFPKLLGGLLLIQLVPGLFYTALGAGYFLIAGIPGEPMGLVTLLFDFMRSWAGILGMLLVYVFKSITYPFEFCVYQQVLDEEQATPVIQLNP
jgi:hypothetical protein